MILKIARMGHPVLRTRSAEVNDIQSPEIARLVDDMIETMKDANGAGLAAPQVHVPLRVMIFHVPRGRDAQIEDGLPLTVLINPEIEPIGEEMNAAFEGCLSLPGMTGKVNRFTQIKYRGFGLDGTLIEREASGFHARVVQHEYDHLDGILYPQRMDDLSTFGYVEEMQKAINQE
ncbi:peptide deformylase [Terasakiella sp.]|uniref:peptide deformylase n=1 Tax=Terasakiella sp. TaxID=2034861 RepID=UPI003AA815C9